MRVDRLVTIGSVLGVALCALALGISLWSIKISREAMQPYGIEKLVDEYWALKAGGCSLPEFDGEGWLCPDMPVEDAAPGSPDRWRAKQHWHVLNNLGCASIALDGEDWFCPEWYDMHAGDEEAISNVSSQVCAMLCKPRGGVMRMYSVDEGHEFLHHRCECYDGESMLMP
jgi:hypothetical protein